MLEIAALVAIISAFAWIVGGIMSALWMDSGDVIPTIGLILSKLAAGIFIISVLVLVFGTLGSALDVRVSVG